MPNKEITKLARTARKQGWTVERTKGDHFRWTPPGGRYVITAQSPRRMESIVRLLRKAGLEIK